MRIWQDRHTKKIHFRAAEVIERTLLIALSSHIEQCFASDDGAIDECAVAYEIGQIEISMHFDEPKD